MKINLLVYHNEIQHKKYDIVHKIDPDKIHVIITSKNIKWYQGLGGE